MAHAPKFKAYSLKRLAEFSALGGPEDTFEIPENLSEQSDEQIASLAADARALFDTIYGNGSNDLSDEDVETLSALTEGLKALSEEQEVRTKKADERRAQAAALREEAGFANEPEEPEAEEAEEEIEVEVEEVEEVEEPEEEALTASAPRRRIAVSKASVARHLPKAQGGEKAELGIKDVLTLTGEVNGFTLGAGLDWDQAGLVLERRLERANMNSYAAAAQRGAPMQRRESLFTISKPTSAETTITDESGAQVEEILRRASSEANTPQGSLVASGGWCAPSETVYGLLELETRDGIFSLPEVTLKRGGIRRTLGPDFGEIYDAANGWHYTEQQDIDGNYGVDADGIGNDTAGTKPCIEVPCPEFEDIRLDIDGLCITSGILQSRGYPEVIARFVRGVTVAHDHKIAGRLLKTIADASQTITFASDQVGATAPILTAVELRAQLLRTKGRLGRNKALEAVFPVWMYGAIRADLSRRLGVDLISVSDARISQWFRDLNVAPQFVYNWQDMDTSATTVAYPTQVEFLLYPAGTWIKGTNSLITIENLYDSTLLAENNYQALWTEEGSKAIRMGHESDRVVVPLSADGATHMGVDILHNGSLAPAGA